MGIPKGQTLYPLCKAQSMLMMGRFFNLDQKMMTAGNIAAMYAFASNNFDINAMEKAFWQMLRVNDALRLRVVRKGLRLMQHIEDFSPKPLDRITVNGREGFEKAKSEIQQRISLFGPLSYAQLVDCGDGSGGIMMQFHHLVCDGYTMSMMFSQIDRFYQLYASGKEPPEEKVYSFTKYIEAEIKYLASPQYKADKKFLRYAYNHQPNYSFPAGRLPLRNRKREIEFSIEGDRYKLLKDFCVEYKCSQPAVLMTLAAIAVYCVSGKENFCFYSLSHGRITAYLKNTMGTMANPFPVFYDIPGSATMKQFILDSYMAFLEWFSHARYPVGEQILMSCKEAVFKHFWCNHCWLFFSPMEFDSSADKTILETGILSIDFMFAIFYCAVLDLPGTKVRFEVSYDIQRISPELMQRVVDIYLGVLNVLLRHPDWTIDECTAYVGKTSKQSAPVS